MATQYRFETYTSTESLPTQWHTVASGNIFLSKAYLEVLETSAPSNMSCTFIALFDQTEIVGVAIAQFIRLKDVKSFGERDNCVKTRIRTFAFRRFSSNVLVLGNNMLTGQNAFKLAARVNVQNALLALESALNEISQHYRRKGEAVHLTIWKDFSECEIKEFSPSVFKGYFRFSTQPNMVFAIPSHWKSADSYFNDLIKKYRDQFKRSRKKAQEVTKRKMPLAEIRTFNGKINELYHNVAANAPFNTFYLHADHFVRLKESLGDHFLFYGYFIDKELIGFNTLIRHGNDIETYFLGYDESQQRNRMLYLNMLYDMIGYAVNKGFKKIIFARTALEIKSSVGAVPEKMYGKIRHSNPLINMFMPRLFKYFEPDVEWKQRHPFRNEEPQLSSASEESRCQD